MRHSSIFASLHKSSSGNTYNFGKKKKMVPTCVGLVQMPVDFPALAVVLIISLLFFVFTVDSKKATDKPRDKGGEPRSLTSDPVAVLGLYFYLSL